MDDDDNNNNNNEENVKAIDKFWNWLTQGCRDKDGAKNDDDDDGDEQRCHADNTLDEDEDDDYYDDNNDYGDYEEDDSHLFPTLPAFTIPVEKRPTPQYGSDDDQYGVFALEDIPAHTSIWKWTWRVNSIHKDVIEDYIREHYEPDDIMEIQKFLRRGFLMPHPNDDYWNSNPDDASCFMNHSSLHPNCGRPHGTLRLIKKGEELTMDYSGNGNPSWYVDLCHKYGILTAVEIAQAENENQGKIQPAKFPLHQQQQQQQSPPLPDKEKVAEKSP